MFRTGSRGNALVMDTTRYEAMTAKRDEVGLTDEEACEHLGCGWLTSESFCSDFCRTHAGESSDAGPEFDRGCGHDA
jgi:hypothetical protein